MERKKPRFRKSFPAGKSPSISNSANPEYQCTSLSTLCGLPVFRPILATGKLSHVPSKRCGGDWGKSKSHRQNRVWVPGILHRKMCDLTLPHFAIESVQDMDALFIEYGARRRCKDPDQPAFLCSFSLGQPQILKSLSCSEKSGSRVRPNRK